MSKFVAQVFDHKEHDLVDENADDHASESRDWLFILLIVLVTCAVEVWIFLL